MTAAQRLKMMDSTGVDCGGQRRTGTGTEARSSHIQYPVRRLVRPELRSVDTSGRQMRATS